jgi:hypothetical protein
MYFLFPIIICFVPLLVLKLRVIILMINNGTFINFGHCVFLTIKNIKVQTMSIEYSTCTCDSHNHGPYFIYLKRYSA